MKTKSLLFIPTLSFLWVTTFGQSPKMQIDENKKNGSVTASQLMISECLGEINTPSADLKWKPILTNKCVAFEPKEPNEELIEKVKAEKLNLKNKSRSKTTSENSENSTQSISPIVGTNFLGNVNNGSSPMDNSIAISDAGIIVSVSNTILEIDNNVGTNLYYNNIVTLINDVTITNVCDPVVLYDKAYDRFIMFVQECTGNSSNSFIFVFFSKTNNPATGGWWKYKLTGNPLNNSTWFDYPKLAISNNELYVTGNLFTNSSVFSQAILYQINKLNGYAGGSLNWLYYTGISGNPFTLLPVSEGQGASYGPGCYLVSTSSNGTSIKLYDLTNDICCSPVLNLYTVTTTPFSPAGDASQLGTTCLLDNGSNRVLSGFYLNGIIHFVFHSDIGSGWNGINYNRLTLSPLGNISSTYGLVGSFDYSYPSIASYATSPTDKSVMIGFGRSGSTIYPEIRVVNCDNAMNWSSSTLVKSSSNYVSYVSTVKERWGDYSGITRRHNSPTPSVWMNHMYGTSANKWNTWIAEIHDNTSVGIKENILTNGMKVFPNPVSDIFNLEFNLSESTELSVNIFDINGKLIKELYIGKAIQGKNLFTFDKSNLSNGTYFLNIKSNSKIIKNEKIIITN